MSIWKYRYKSLAGVEIHEDFLEIPDDNDRVAVIERIQELRIELNQQGFQFIDAGSATDAEKGISRKLIQFRRFKVPSRVNPSRRPSFLWIVSLILLVLLLLLVIL